MGSRAVHSKSTQQWGFADDETVPGDYDGDGKTDLSVFRPIDFDLVDSQQFVGRRLLDEFPFGQSGDKTAQADFDGDGRTDVAIFRPDTNAHQGMWYIQRTVRTAARRFSNSD